MQEENKQSYPVLTRLDSSSGPALGPDEEPTIIPLHKQEKKEVVRIDDSVAKYVEMQSNRVVAFLINWIKTNYTRDLYTWLKTEFKQELLKEMKK